MGRVGIDDTFGYLSPMNADPLQRDLAQLRLALVRIAAVSLVFSIYYVTASRTVGPGDSGELTVVMSRFGVAHAPGYPLLSILGNIVTRCALTEHAAFVLNVFNAVLAALAALVLGNTVAAVSGRAMAGVVTTLAVGTTRIYWEYACVNEVFALNDLLAALAMRFAAAAIMAGGVARPAPLLGLAAVLAGAITHHLTLALVGLPLLLIVVIHAVRAGWFTGSERRRSSQTLAACVLVGVLALLPILYLPLAARRNPSLNWGDPRTLSRTIDLLMRKDFGSSSLMNADLAASLVMANGVESSPTGGAHARLFFAELPETMGYVWTLLAVFGAYVLWQRHRLWFWFLIGHAALFAVFLMRVNTPLLPLHIGVVERFWILPHFVLGFVAGVGWAGIEVLWLERRRMFLYAPRALVIATTCGAAVLTNYVTLDRSRETFTRDFGRNIMEGLPSGTLIIGQGDMFHNAFYYVRDVLGERTDIDWLDLQKITFEWGVDSVRREGRVRLPEAMTSYDPHREGSRLKDLIDANFGRREVVVCRNDDLSAASAYELLPSGFWSVVRRKGQPIDLFLESLRYARIAGSWNLGSLNHRHSERSWEASETSNYVAAFIEVGAFAEIYEGISWDLSDFAMQHEPAERWYAAASRLTQMKPGALEAQRAVLLLNTLARGPQVTGLEKDQNRLLRKARELAEAAIRADDRQINAYKVLVALANSQGVEPVIDLGRQLEWQGRVVDLAPHESAEMDRYLGLVSRALADPKLRAPGLMEEAIRRQTRQLEVLDLGLTISSSKDLVAMREGVAKSRGVSQGVLDQLRAEASRQNSRR